MTRTMIIDGGPLSPGEVSISGHKHSIVPIIAATLCTSAKVCLTRVPRIADPLTLSQILEAGGARARWHGDDLHLDTTGFSATALPEAPSAAIHGSVYLIPALLGRLGRVRFERAGGCQIGDADDRGARPIHHMLSVLERFGARFEQSGVAIEGRSPRFTGCDVDIMDYSDRADLLTGPLVSGATKTAILAAMCVDRGGTRIRHPYPKPDVTELLGFARACGMNVRASEREIVIDTRARQDPRSLTYRVISDLSEVMTYVCASVVHHIPIALTGLVPEKVQAGLREELRILARMGVGLSWGASTLHVRPPTTVQSVDIEVTSVGIYSDHQPFFALMLLGGDRPATIREHVWTNRFDYARELGHLGARIEFGQAAITLFPSILSAPHRMLQAADLRAAAVLLLAALGVAGRTVLMGVDHLERGYVSLERELARLGARLRVQSPAQRIPAHCESSAEIQA
jgi:UDP-N-acetylglucosamine 1-carboxyvinyltransferase